MATRPAPRHLTIDLVLPTAHCAGCRRAVVDELSRLDGIVDVVIDADRGTTQITFDSAVVTAPEIIRRLSEAGYPPANPTTRQPQSSTTTPGGHS